MKNKPNRFLKPVRFTIYTNLHLPGKIYLFLKLLKNG